MTRGDQAVETAADKLETVVKEAQRSGGVKAKVGAALADDPEFLRKLKPSLIAARAKGEAPTDGEATQVTPPAPKQKPKAKKKRGGGPNPFVVIAALFAVGVALAHGVDWVGQRYPRD